MARTFLGWVAILAVLVVLPSCEAPAGVATRTEAILEGTLPLVPDTAPPMSDSLHRRDAVVRTFSAGAGCGGVLVGPRVVLTAAHCGHPDAVRFGPDFASALPARVISCLAHPGALLGTPNPSCVEMGLNREGLAPGGRVTSLEYSVLILDRRVDVTHGTSIPARPMSLSAELVAPPPPGPGPELRWVSIRHFPPPPPPSTDEPLPDLAAGRIHAPPVFFGGLGQRFGVSPTLGNFTLINVPLGTVANIAPGDSGSAFYTGDPDDPDPEPRLVALLSRFGNATRPVWDPEVGEWLEQFLTERTPLVPGVYLGPADLPIGDPGDPRDGDGLLPHHDVCPDHYDPDQVNTDGDRWGDECDNCPLHRNDLQTNCNEDAEVAEGILDGPGDACDPIRCGETGLSATRTRSDTPFVSIETDDRISIDARQSDAGEDYDTAFRFCRCPVANRDSFDVRAVCRPPLGNCSLRDVLAFDRSEDALDGWRHVTWRASETTAATRGSVSATYAPLPFVGVPFPFLGSPAQADERFVVDLSVRWVLRDVGGDLERWTGSPLFDTFPVGPGAAGSVPGVFWTFAHARLSGSGTITDSDLLPHHYWSGSVDAGREVTRLPSPGYRCLDFLVPLLSRTGSALTLAAGSPLAFIARPGLPGIGPCIFDRSTPVVVASDVVIDPSVLDVPGLANLNESVGLWVAASETGGWLATGGIRYAGVEPGAELPLVRRTLVETPRGLEPLDKLNPCPNCPCPNCPPMAFPMAGMEDASARRAGLAVADDPGVFVLSATRRVLWRLGGTTSGEPRTTVGVYLPDTDSWHSVLVPGAASEGLGTVLAATYSPAEDTLYFLSERPGGRDGRGRAHPLNIALVRLNPDSYAMTTVAEWPRFTHNDVFAMSPDLGGALYIAASRSDGRAHVGVLVEPREDGLRLVATFAGSGRLVPYGVRAEENGVTVAVVRREGPTAVSYPRGDRAERGFFNRCF